MKYFKWIAITLLLSALKPYCRESAITEPPGRFSFFEPKSVTFTPIATRLDSIIVIETSLTPLYDGKGHFEYAFYSPLYGIQVIEPVQTTFSLSQIESIQSRVFNVKGGVDYVAGRPIKNTLKFRVLENPSLSKIYGLSIFTTATVDLVDRNGSRVENPLIYGFRISMRIDSLGNVIYL